MNSVKKPLPERLSVMWQNSRKTRHGWEVPIQAASSDPALGGGNVVAIVYLGGHGGISQTKDSVEAMAEAIVQSYNDRESLEAEINDIRQALNSSMAIIERLRTRIEVDEGDVDEAGIGDISSNEDSPKIVAWMRGNGFEFVDYGDPHRPAGIWRGDFLVCDSPPTADERVVNDLAAAVGRPPLDVLAEIAETEWSCEHCGKPETQEPRHCDFCRCGMCFECTETHDEQDRCPIQEGKNV